jgi:hypothetical protein
MTQSEYGLSARVDTGSVATEACSRSNGTVNATMPRKPDRVLLRPKKSRFHSSLPARTIIARRYESLSPDASARWTTTDISR